MGSFGEHTTTAMLRNIPSRYSQNDLLEEIDGSGFAGEYNFFYLPIDMQTRSNVGYAFINFSTPESLRRFAKDFAGHRFQERAASGEGGKVAKVSLAHMQGFVENVLHFANRAVAHARNGQHRPIVIIGGQRMDLNEAAALLLAFRQQSWHSSAAAFAEDYYFQQWYGGGEFDAGAWNSSMPVGAASDEAQAWSWMEAMNVASGSSLSSDPWQQNLTGQEWHSSLPSAEAAKATKPLWGAAEEMFASLPCDGGASLTGPVDKIASSFESPAAGLGGEALWDEGEPFNLFDRSGLERALSRWLDNASGDKVDAGKEDADDASSAATLEPPASSASSPSSECAPASRRSLSPTAKATKLWP